MSLRRDLRKLIRAATKALVVYTETRRSPAMAVDAGDGGKGADALGKALGEFQQDPTLAALDTTPPKSYASFGDIHGKPRPSTDAEKQEYNNLLDKVGPDGISSARGAPPA